MAMRPLEKLPSIRAKLGSVIVLAVAMTLLISYAVIGYALRDSPRDSEAIDALGSRQGGGGQLQNIPSDTEIVRRAPTERHDRGRSHSPCLPDRSPMAFPIGAWSGTSRGRVCRRPTAAG